jgi:hypothetical protein
MKTGVSCVALGFGLFTETFVALAQTTGPTFVAQGPSSAPPSGILATPPAAPVSVPLGFGKMPEGLAQTKPPGSRQPGKPFGSPRAQP